MTAKPKRRWFQFSLKKLMLLTALFGCGLGPIVYQRHLAQQQHQIKAELEEHRILLLGGQAQSQRPNWLKKILGDDVAGLDSTIQVYANRSATSESSLERTINKLNQLPSVTMLSFADKKIDDRELAHFQHLTNIHAVFLDGSLITEDGLKYLRGYKNLQALALLATNFGDSGVKELAHHPNLSALWLNSTNVTDDGLVELGQLKNLKFLDVSSTRVTDAGMKILQDFQALEHIGCGGTSVSDAGVRELRPLVSLISIDLRGTKVTDASLIEFENHPNLCSVDVSGTAVTYPAIRKLKKAIPNLYVNHDP
jgi:hypothetical protein